MYICVYIYVGGSFPCCCERKRWMCAVFFITCYQQCFSYASYLDFMS